MPDAQLIIMRHGETQYNAEHRLTGRADIPLTKKGEAQGRQAGAVLKHFNIKAAYASDLRRSFDTLCLALDAANSHENLKNDDGSWKIERRGALDEKDVGILTGKLKSEIEDIAPGHKQSYDNRLPNGETNREVVERVEKFFNKEIKPMLAKGDTVVISCHAVVLKAFMVILGEVSGERMHEAKVPNATPWVIDYDKGQKTASRFVDPKTMKERAVVVLPKAKRPKPPQHQ